MLNGEITCCNCKEITYFCPFTSSQPALIRGTLTITNYRLYFHSHQQYKDRSVVLDLPLGLVSRVDRVGVSRKLGNTYGFEVVCKDIRTLKFVLTETETSGHPRRQIFEALLSNAFPLSYASQLFAFKFGEQCGTEDNNGWRVYDPTEELKRMGLPNKQWLISNVNQNYRICDTYPPILGLPARTTLDELHMVAKFRSKGRIPVLSWIHPESRVTITRFRCGLKIALSYLIDDKGKILCPNKTGKVQNDFLRCSQPLVGLNKKRSKARSKEDEQHVQNILDANTLSSKIYIYDARPKVCFSRSSTSCSSNEGKDEMYLAHK